VAITTQEIVQVRQPARPGRHGIVHKQLLILLEPGCMLAAFSRFTQRNKRRVNDINVVYFTLHYSACTDHSRMHFNAFCPEIWTYFTCYWDVKPAAPAVRGAPSARSSRLARPNPS
jgi:hypothetical protein